MKRISTLSISQRFLFRRIPKAILQTFLMVSLLFLSYNSLQSCGGTPPPPCTGKSVFLAKFTPGVVVFPAAGPINVPIGILPFVFWDPRPICPSPVGPATLTLTLNCVPSGAVITQTFTLPTPVAPGAQPLGGPVNFTIPAGLFPPGTPPQICLVVGSYNISFSDGVNLTGVGDTEVCLVPPTPLDASKPRLNMTYVSEDNSLYKTCRRGDQSILYFLIDNNDPDYSVRLNLSSLGRQVSQLPEGYTTQDAYEKGVYAISMPEDSTDTFAAAFADDLSPGELLPEPDPYAKDLQELSRSISLKPCESIIVGIAMRSYGMCADGSCNERLVKVEGNFSNGDDALACASTLFVVGEAPPKSPLCEISDQFKVDEISDATWSHTQYYENGEPIPHAQTFMAGNLPPSFGGGYRTVGGSDTEFRNSASDYLRMTQVATEARYSVRYERQRSVCRGFPPNGMNTVSVTGLNTSNPTMSEFPVIGFVEPLDQLFININVATDELQIISGNGDVLYRGSAREFMERPPREFCIFKGICRTIKKASSFDEKAVYVTPPTAARLFDLSVFNPGPCEAQDTFDVFDQDGNLISWDAVINGSGIGLPSNSGFGQLEICYEDLVDLPKVPETTVSFIEVTCPGALNTERVPVAIRVKDKTKILNDVEDLDDLTKHKLFTAAPNPFRSNTNIRYRLGHTAKVNLQIYNHLGQHVRTLLTSQEALAGEYNIDWDGTSDSGASASPGIYICRMEVDGWISTKKMIVLE